MADVDDLKWYGGPNVARRLRRRAMAARQIMQEQRRLDPIDRLLLAPAGREMVARFFAVGDTEGLRELDLAVAWAAVLDELAQKTAATGRRVEPVVTTQETRQRLHELVALRRPARCGMMIGCAAPTGLSRCDERIRVTATAGGERPGQGRRDLGATPPVGFQNSAIGPDLDFYAARSYSLTRPPRTGRRWIRFRERSATG